MPEAIMSKYVYWREQCKSCTNRQHCLHREQTEDLIRKLSELERNHIGAYGTLKFTCDYFVVDVTTLDMTGHTCGG